MIQATGLTKKYNTKTVLNEISLTIQKGEIVSIVGASGAGKSTLLHLLGTLDSADSGQILFLDQDLKNLNADQLAVFRNENIGFIFQFHNLLPEFTAIENVSMPAWILNKKTNQAITQDALNLIEILGLAGKENQLPSQLSGGEQQRVAVARALINSPLVVFADEPSGNLDSYNARELHDLFFKLRESLGQTFVIVTHNEELAQRADRKIEMKDGKII